MTGFMRNPEIRRGMIVYSLITILFTTAAYLFQADFAVVVFCICIFFVGLHYAVTSYRYRELARMSRDIDAILHGKETLNFQSCKEGELAILQNEIAKMTIRLSEQAEALKADKVFLADSIADISHQIRTPLTSLNLMASFLDEPGLSEQRRLELVREIMQMLSRIDWLITTLLKMSRLDAGTIAFAKESVLVSEVIEEASKPLAVPMELRGQALVVRCHADVGYTGDLSWTAEAVGNILKNCMEHTPEGGIVEVTASQNAIYAEIVIQDSGAGMDEEDIPHLFERFYRGKNAGNQSFGIGLALARMIVIKQNGTIKAENGKNGGARFTIRFYKITV